MSDTIKDKHKFRIFILILRNEQIQYVDQETKQPEEEQTD